MKFSRNQPRSQPIVRVARLAGPALVALLHSRRISAVVTFSGASFVVLGKASGFAAIIATCRASTAATASSLAAGRTATIIGTPTITSSKAVAVDVARRGDRGADNPRHVADPSRRGFSSGRVVE